MRFVHFSDDTTVFASDSDITNVHAIVNRELEGNWRKTNRLSMNVSKISYMIISNQKNASDIKLRGSIHTKVSTVKYLGLALVTFNNDEKTTSTKISKSWCHEETSLPVACIRNG